MSAIFHATQKFKFWKPQKYPIGIANLSPLICKYIDITCDQLHKAVRITRVEPIIEKRQRMPFVFRRERHPVGSARWPSATRRATSKAGRTAVETVAFGRNGRMCYDNINLCILGGRDDTIAMGLQRIIF